MVALLFLACLLFYAMVLIFLRPVITKKLLKG